MAPDSLNHLVAASQLPDNGVFPFLKLPVEIRMNIYLFIYLTTPIQPDLKLVAGCHSIKSCLGGPRDKVLGFDNSRPLLAALPSTILLVCKHIYYECRETPFHHNLFEFVGKLHYEDPFAHTRKPWQVNAIQHASVHAIMNGQNPQPCLSELHNLCEFLARGLRVLRLTMTIFGPPVLESLQHHLCRGLSLLQRLQRLELDVRHAQGRTVVSKQWTQNLEKMLNSSKPDVSQHVQVVCLGSSLLAHDFEDEAAANQESASGPSHGLSSSVIFGWEL